MSLPDTVTTAERGRAFWRGVLLGGSFTALPRWTREPVAITLDRALSFKDLAAHPILADQATLISSRKAALK